MRRLLLSTASNRVRAAHATPGASQAIDAAVALLDNKLRVLRRHIEKENMILLPMADQMLTPEEMGEAARGMERLIAARRCGQ